MSNDMKKNLTYVLANGYERTISLNPEILDDFIKWYSDSNSSNSFEFSEGASEKTVLYKNTLLSIRY